MKKATARALVVAWRAEAARESKGAGNYYPLRRSGSLTVYVAAPALHPKYLIHCARCGYSRWYWTLEMAEASLRSHCREYKSHHARVAAWMRKYPPKSR